MHLLAVYFVLINTRKWDVGALELVQDEACKGYMQDICYASLSWGKNIGHIFLLLQFA